jgi:hypothetical protein
MAFVLNSDIAIGKFVGVKPNNVKVKKSIFEYVDKAVIKLPITARIKRAGEVITATVETAKQINEGDKVVIKLGYNGVLKTEFEGFVSRINFTSPLEVECEGYSYLLRKKQLTGTLVNVELLTVLKKITEGTDIILDEKNIPKFKIDKLILTGKNGTTILEELKGTSKQLMRFFFTGNKLWGGLTYLSIKAIVKYQLGWNVIKDGNLKQRLAKNDNYQIHWIGEKKDGSKVTAKAGKKGIIKTHSSHIITDQDSLQQLSDAGLKKLSYDGYEGKITAFGIPYCETGDKANLIDNKYPERGGNYIIESTEVSYGMDGYRRIVGIGAKL